MTPKIQGMLKFYFWIFSMLINLECNMTNFTKLPIFNCILLEFVIHFGQKRKFCTKFYKKMGFIQNLYHIYTVETGRSFYWFSSQAWLGRWGELYKKNHLKVKTLAKLGGGGLTPVELWYIFFLNMQKFSLLLNREGGSGYLYEEEKN